MSIWRTSGAVDPDTLRKLFLKRSLNRSSQIVVQVGGQVGARGSVLPYRPACRRMELPAAGRHDACDKAAVRPVRAQPLLACCRPLPQLLVDAAAGAGAFYAARGITPDQLGSWSLATK